MSGFLRLWACNLSHHIRDLVPDLRGFQRTVMKLVYKKVFYLPIPRPQYRALAPQTALRGIARLGDTSRCFPWAGRPSTSLSPTPLHWLYTFWILLLSLAYVIPFTAHYHLVLFCIYIVCTVLVEHIYEHLINIYIHLILFYY